MCDPLCVPNRRCLRGLVVSLALCAFALIVARPPRTQAQQLAFRSYTVVMGLPNSRVSAIYHDTRGYLWFGTLDGLSRFDGYRFTNYGSADGIRDPYVRGITEDPSGRLWLGTNSGIACLVDNPARIPYFGQPQTTPQTTPPASRFVTFPVADGQAANTVDSLLFDRAGNLWCNTEAGLFEARSDNHGGFAAFTMIEPLREPPEFYYPGLRDRQNRLWFATNDQLLLVDGSRVVRFRSPDEHGKSVVIGLAEDTRGRLFAASDDALFEFLEPAAPNPPGRWQRLPLVLRSQQSIHALTMDPDGSLWIGTSMGLIRYSD